jgi:serine/threonine-protein kinase
MGKVVIFNLLDGSLDDGLSLRLGIHTEGDRHWIGESQGKLPPNPNLINFYNNWSDSYLARVAPWRKVRISGDVCPDASVHNIRQASQQLKLNFNQWLDSPEMSRIREELLYTLTNRDEEIRFIIQTENINLQRLPWQAWDFIRERYKKSETVLYLPVKQKLIVNTRNKVRVLAVFGKRETIGQTTYIKTEKDWEFLKQHLSENSNAKLIRLIEPTLEELCEQIENQHPQILFFAGHSSSDEEGINGRIELNQDETITIDDLETDLREAVDNGLELAIFNSCDGLGIARQMAKLHIPNIIIMRESVPDTVAQKFLQRFLEAFAAGKPLHIALLKAREKINRFENQYPGAIWLPTAFQNPAADALTWESLGGIVIQQNSPVVNNNPREYNQISRQESPTFNQNQNLNPNQNQAESVVWLPTNVGEPDIPPETPPEIPPVTNISLPAPESAITQKAVRETPAFITCSKGHDNPLTNNFCIFCGERLIQAITVLPRNSINNNSLPFIPSITGINSLPRLYLPAINNENKDNFNNILVGDILHERYQIIEMLGQGGFGQTYLAKDINSQTNSLCVVKRLNPIDPSLSSLSMVRHFFEMEAHLLYKLSHGQMSIPKLLAHFEEDNILYLVQDFIDGEDLSKELIPGKKMSESYVTSLLKNILQILDFIHNYSVIHRDIKPSNIIRRKEDGKIFLIDFGAVKELRNTNLDSQTVGIAIGTPGYAPPEQLMGQPRPNSDIYALGITCIQAATGIQPLKLSTDPNTGEIIWRNHVEISSQLAQILYKMVRYNFQDRYQSVADVLADLNDM